MSDNTLETLKDATMIEITDELRATIQAEAEESFPDDAGTRFVVTGAIASNGMSYIEVTPDKDTGYEKYMFELNAQNKVTKGYAYEDNNYSLLFTSPHDNGR